jgi:phosphoribosylpyrophosphate synthetase
MLEALRLIRPLAQAAPVVIAVHGILAGRTERMIEEASAKLVATNSVPNASRLIDIAGLIAREITRLAIGSF